MHGNSAPARERATRGRLGRPVERRLRHGVVERIRDENYPFGARGDGWAFWVNDRAASVGLCDTSAQEGDESSSRRPCFDAEPPDYVTNPPVLPLALPRRLGADRLAERTVSVATLDTRQRRGGRPRRGHRPA